MKNLDYPISAPSANKFGYISPTRTEHIIKNFSQGIDYVLDGGACELGIESTIIGFENKNTIVYRLGSLVVEDIEKCVGDITIYSNEESFPGSFKSHYSPSKKLYLGDIKMLTDKFKDKRIGVLCFDKYYDFIEEKNQILLSINALKTEFRIGDRILKAVDDVSLTVDKGQCLGIIGESGSGKSVTALSVMRLVSSPPGVITNGSIDFNGGDLLELSSEDLRAFRGKKISYVFKNYRFWQTCCPNVYARYF